MANDIYPLTLIDGVLLDRLRKAKYFVKLGLKDTYRLKRFREGDRPMEDGLQDVICYYTL